MILFSADNESFTRDALLRASAKRERLGKNLRQPRPAVGNYFRPPTICAAASEQ